MALSTEIAPIVKRLALHRYRPYDKQKEFHAAGRDHRERLFMAGNQLGKTWAGAYETAMHLTGVYPDNWPGRRFDHPVHAWAAGITGESTRDNPQRLLLGPPADKDQWGTAAIPGDALITWSASRGIADSVDQAVIRHASGGQSILGFKSYERGREKWQGPTLHVVWFDEEPPADIYSEGVTRTNATGGINYITATPLLGMSDVVRLFYPAPQTAQRHMTRMELEDAPHISAEVRAEIIEGYPSHERDARTRGIPMLGSGRIFPVAEEALKCAPFQVPDWYAQIGGLDFGWDHPTAAVRLAWDRDDDILYVTNCYRQSEATPVVHAAAVKPWGDWLPWSWPHDALQHDKGSGEPLADQYRAQGLNLLPERATFEDGQSGVEAGLMLLLDYMQAGRFKVFSHLEDWFDEFRTYHRKDGKVVKERDDLMSATRYAAMMLRHARAKPSRRRAGPRSYNTRYKVLR